MVALGITKQLLGRVLTRNNHLLRRRARLIALREKRLFGSRLTCNVNGLAQAAQGTDDSTDYRYYRT